MNTVKMIHLLSYAEGLTAEFLDRAAVRVEALRADKTSAEQAEHLSAALDMVRAHAAPTALETEVAEAEPAKLRMES